jgi:amino acid permease
MVVVGFTIALKNDLDKFTAVLGAFCCAPVAFILPAAFHIKCCAESSK